MRDLHFVALLLISAALVAASIATLNPVLIMASALSLSVVAMLYRLWFVLEPLLFRHTHAVEVFSGYELSGARDTAIRRLKGMFSATAVAAFTVNPKRSIDREQLEELVERTNAPFKFVLQAERLGARRLIDAMQTRLSMKRIALSKLGGSAQDKIRAKAEALKREIQELESELAALRESAPMRLRNYLFTSAASESRSVASERAKAQLRDLSSRFSALLGTEASLLSGSDLLSVLELDSTMVEWA